MTLKDELSLLVDPEKNLLAGYLGMTPNQVEVPNRDGYVYVRLLDNANELVHAYNDKVSAIYNIPVFIAFDGKKYVVTGVNNNKYSGGGGNSFFLPKHGPQHSKAVVGGQAADIVWVDESQFLPLLARPIGTTGSTSVQVSPYMFINTAGVWTYLGTTGIHIPNAPTGSLVSLLMLRDSDAQYYILPGGSPTGVPASLSDYVPYLPTPANRADIPIAAIYTTQQGSPVSWKGIAGTRQFYGGGGAGLPILQGNRVVTTNSSGTLTTNDRFTYDDVNNYMMLGEIDPATPQPSSSFVIGAASGSASVFLESFSNISTAASFISGVRGRGTNLIPLPVQKDDVLFRVRGRAYDGTGFAASTSVEIRMLADETHDAISHGTRMEFYTTPTGTNTQELALTLEQYGGTDIPTGTYNVGGFPHTHASSTGTASISLQIDQSGGTSDTYGVLAGAINGSNKVYTVSLSKYVIGSLVVYLHGQLQTQGSAEDWVETSPAAGTFTFAIAPIAGDLLTVAYQFSSGASGDADTLDGYHASAFVLSGNTVIVSGTYLTLSTDEFIVCDSPTAMNILLPIAVASSKRVLEIKNINIGIVTLVTSGVDTVDDELRQTIGQWDCIKIRNYAANKWAIT